MVDGGKSCYCIGNQGRWKTPWERNSEMKKLAIAALMACAFGIGTASAVTMNWTNSAGTTTTTHKTLRGPRGGMILSDAETAKKFNFNKNKPTHNC